jgi:hypothetical protein
MAIAADGAQSSVIPGGSTLYPEFKCRAWVNFDGTGTPSIRASGNVSSITDNGTGTYTVNFTTAMPDANYSLVAGAVGVTSGNLSNTVVVEGTTAGGAANKTTSAVSIQSGGTASSVLRDLAEINISIFR